MDIAGYIKNKLPYWPNFITYPLMKMNRFKGLCYGKAYNSYGKSVESTTPEQKLVEISNFAITNVPYYRKRYKGVVIKNKEDFEQKISLIDKEEVLAHWDEFISDGADRTRCYVESTGGTSGKPMKFLSPNNRYIHSMYFWHKQLKHFGWNYDPVAVIRNHHLPSGRDFIINPIMKQVIFDGFMLNDAYCRKILNVMLKKHIVYLYCYPSAAYTFLKSCYSQNLDTSFIKACFLTSEQITDYQYQFIHDRLGIAVLGSYGHSEKLCQAGTHPDCFLYFIDEQYGYTELVDKDGHVIERPEIIGEIVGTTFNNRYFPLLRYRTGDYSAYALKKHVQHNEVRVLNKIEGRWNKSLIYRPDGSTTTLTALNVHGDFNDHIKGLQFVQNELNRLTVLIIKDSDYSEKDELYIKSHLLKAMGPSVSVEIEYVNNLILQPNGKFLPLISKLEC